MHLKKNINYIDLLDSCARCTGEVLFTTPEGDILNLKSELSRYVFAALTPDADFMSRGSIVYKNPADHFYLRGFLEE